MNYERQQDSIEILGLHIVPALMEDMQNKLHKDFGYGTNPLDISHRGNKGFVALIAIIGNWPDCKITLNGRPFLVNYNAEKPDVFRYAPLDDEEVVLNVVEAVAKNNIIWSNELKLKGDEKESNVRACVLPRIEGIPRFDVYKVSDDLAVSTTISKGSGL